MQHRSSAFMYLLVILSIWQTSVRAQSQELTVEWIYSDEKAKVEALPRFTWLADNTALLCDTLRPKSERVFEKLDPRKGKMKTMLVMEKALANLEELVGKKQTERCPAWPQAFDQNGKRALFLIDGDIFLLEVEKGTFSRVTETAAVEKSVNFSPDGSRLAFVRENDLFVYDILNKTETRLTDTGSETILNGTLSWVYWEEIFGRQDIGYWWSDDSKAIAFLQTDESPVSLMHFVDFKPNVPRLIKQRYPKAGTANPIVRIGVATVDSGATTWLHLPTYEYVARVKWLPDNSRLSVQTLNRAQTELNLYFIDRKTGKASLILQETDSAWVNINDDFFFLKDGRHFVWASERTGYAHLYRYTLDGQLVNQITHGEWAIRSSGGGVYWLRQAVAAIDEKNGWLYFTALEKSSVERHLYRVRLDGSGMERLSQVDGTHAITFSPNGEYYFDVHSTVATLPTLTLHKNDGNPVKTLAKGREQLLAGFELQYRELFTIPTADNFPMPAALLKPADFDTAKKYPVIVFVYGGPSAPSVADAWNSSTYFDNILLKHGFLVATIDNRSATAISKILENTAALQMSGPTELRDLVDAVKWLKAQAYVDPERVGIWGWSGGGSFTLNAMTNSTEFKAGIAVAAVSDWHYYDTKWAEFGMKRPEDNPDGYEKTSYVKSAKNLHGRLLLVHGTYDDNVHPQNAWAFADELIKHDIKFDMMIYPMRKHGITDRPARIHLFETMLEFWNRNLQ